VISEDRGANFFAAGRADDSNVMVSTLARISHTPIDDGGLREVFERLRGGEPD
jgi:hypothetical protein